MKENIEIYISIIVFFEVIKYIWVRISFRIVHNKQDVLTYKYNSIDHMKELDNIEHNHRQQPPENVNIASDFV